MNTQDLPPLGWTGWISWQSKGLSRVFSSTTVQKHQFFDAQLSSQSNSHNCMLTTGKTLTLIIWTSDHRVMSLLLNTLVGSVQFSRSVMSNSLRPHESQHTRPPCPSPTPGVHPNPCPLSRGCHPAVSSCVIPFSSCLQSLPASGSFQMSQLFASGGQSIGVSALASVLPMNTQD